MQPRWEIEQDWYAGLARRVQSLMSERKMSLHGLSKLSGVSFYQSDRYIRQGRRMPAFVLYRYATALGVSVSELVADVPDKPAQAAFDFG